MTKSVVSKIYLSADGESRHANATATALRFDFGGEADPITVEFDSLSDDIMKAAAAHGLSQKLGDALAAPRGTDMESRVSRLVATIEALQDGSWVSQRESVGAPKGDLFSALIRYAAEKSGGECSKEQEQRIANRLKEMTPEDRRATSATPAIAKHINDIRMERAAAKAAKLAGAEGTDELDDLVA